MKLIIFGTGLFYQNRKMELPKSADILVFLDNNKEVWGKVLDGKKIVSPDSVENYEYDLILLMSKRDEEMKQQLLALHVEEEKIVTWNCFEKEHEHGKFRYFCGQRLHDAKAKILIISTPLGYTGAPLTALYAAMALSGKGYEVVLCAKGGNRKFINEVVLAGVHVVLCPAIPYLEEEELFWMEQFDAVIVNTFLMLQCACMISRYRPTIWWIHECSEKYENYYTNTMNEFSEYVGQIQMTKMDIVGVSSIAKENFNFFFHDRIYQILPYGIPDKGGMVEPRQGTKNKCVFVVIGSICQRKGQREFLEAVKRLDSGNAEFWIIGAGASNEYTDNIMKIAQQHNNIKVFGELSRHEMEIVYKEIDVVVCPSLEETMSIVLTEGMMYGKICITTDKTGMADYIMHGRNGLVCEAGNVDSLYSCMQWVLENIDRADEMRMEARKTYEQYFMLDRFADQLEEILLQARQKYGEKKENSVSE